MKELVEEEENLKKYQGQIPPKEVLRQAKENGFSDKYLSQILMIDEDTIRKARKEANITAGWEVFM